MQKLVSKPKYVVKLWPRAHRRQQVEPRELLQRMEHLRNKISTAWQQGVGVIDEIKAQRTKPYDIYD